MESAKTGEMDKESADASIPAAASHVEPPPVIDPAPDSSARDGSPRLSAAGISSWAKNLRIPQSLSTAQDDSAASNGGKSTFARFTSGLGLRLSPRSPPADDSSGSPSAAQPGFIGTITKGLVDSSKSAVKAVQVKARHVVSQNKRRYQVS